MARDPNGALPLFSRVVRRTHMYLGLFLVPWMLMYALSTIVMNHRAIFSAPGPPLVQKESEQIYQGTFPAGATPAAMASQILADLHLNGTYSVNAARDGRRITIVRQDPVNPRRIVYTPADHKLVVEKEVFRAPAFLERFHRRRGYQPAFPLQTAWAVSVDTTIAAMLFWAASGLWLWWELKRTRLLGALLAASGCAIFALFILTI